MKMLSLCISLSQLCSLIRRNKFYDFYGETFEMKHLKFPLKSMKT